MVDLAKLDELIARVEKATKPDRELDVYLHVVGYTKEWNWQIQKDPFSLSDPLIYAVPAYTGLIDDALQLVTHVLPDWGSMILSWSGDGKFATFRMERSYPTNLEVAVEHHTRPLAIILALLKALREAGHEH